MVLWMSFSCLRSCGGCTCTCNPAPCCLPGPPNVLGGANPPRCGPPRTPTGPVGRGAIAPNGLDWVPKGIEAAPATVDGRWRVISNQNPVPRYCPFSEDTVASISEDGVSEDNVTSAEDAFRIEGLGCDGPGGGGAGIIRIESILRGVLANNFVIVSLFVLGGRDRNCTVGFGCCLALSESPSSKLVQKAPP